MLVVFLIIAAVCYVVLYLVWRATQGHLDSSPSFVQGLGHLLFMPEGLIFTILHSLVLLTFLYLVADYFLSLRRRHRLHKQKEADRAYKRKLTGADSPQPPVKSNHRSKTQIG